MTKDSILSFSQWHYQYFLRTFFPAPAGLLHGCGGKGSSGSVFGSGRPDPRNFGAITGLFLIICPEPRTFEIRKFGLLAQCFHLLVKSAIFLPKSMPNRLEQKNINVLTPEKQRFLFIHHCTARKISMSLSFAFWLRLLFCQLFCFIASFLSPKAMRFIWTKNGMFAIGPTW